MIIVIFQTSYKQTVQKMADQIKPECHKLRTAVKYGGPASICLSAVIVFAAQFIKPAKTKRN